MVRDKQRNSLRTARSQCMPSSANSIRTWRMPGVVRITEVIRGLEPDDSYEICPRSIHNLLASGFFQLRQRLPSSLAYRSCLHYA